MGNDTCDLVWTNCLLALSGLNELSNKKSEKKHERILNILLKIARLILILYYVHLTTQMLAISVMGIYLKHNRLPLLIWYYYAIIQALSGIQWYLNIEGRSTNNAQLNLMARVMSIKRRKITKNLDATLSSVLFIAFSVFAILIPLFTLLMKNSKDLSKWYSSKSAESSAAYVHNFIIPCSEISSIAVLIASKMYVTFFHIHLYQVAQTLKEKITGLNSENKERLINRFLEWIQRREEAMKRFSLFIFCWSLNLVVNFMVKSVDGFDKTPRPDLYPFKIFSMVILFLFFGLCSCKSYNAFKDTHAAAIKYLKQKENNNRVQSSHKNYEPENEILEQLVNNVHIEPSYILSIYKLKIFEINSNLPFKIFMTFLVLHLFPSMFTNK